MSLFMNMVEHPEMFMNSKDISTTNQHYYKYDSFAELIKSQKEINHSLQNSFQLLQSMYNQQQYSQMNQWQELTDQRDQIETMLVSEVELKDEFIEQINQMIKNNEQIIKAELHQYGTSTEKLSSKLQELHQFQQTTSEQIRSQQKEQTNMKEKIENQEALMEKVSRQLANFRSILYERTDNLAGKIEESYEMTSAYFYQLLTGTAEPFPTFMSKRKQKDKQNTK